MGGRPDLTILGRGSVSDISGPPTRPDEDGAAVGEVLAGYAGVSTAGESVRSGLSNVEGLMSGDERSEVRRLPGEGGGWSGWGSTFWAL